VESINTLALEVVLANNEGLHNFWADGKIPYLKNVQATYIYAFLLECSIEEAMSRLGIEPILIHGVYAFDRLMMWIKNDLEAKK
jgi:hypothetical protein